MAVRQKLRSLVKSRSRADSARKSDSTDSGSRERWPSNVYKPGEPMPRPKYRMPAKKEHTDKLEAFSFSDSWRRKSFQSAYSPMGTRAPSRRASFVSVTGGRRHSLNRSSSIKSTDADVVRTIPRPAVMVRGATGTTLSRLNTVDQADDDFDVHNVGMSRVQSHERVPQLKTHPHAADVAMALNGQPRLELGASAHDHEPFTEDDLVRALTMHRLVEPVS